MLFNLTVKVRATDALGASIGVGRVGLTYAQQISIAPVQINQMIKSLLLGQAQTIPNLVLARLAITVEAADYTPERAVLTFDDDAQVWQTSNPHVRATGSLTDMTVMARLGVMRYAPIKMLPETMPAKSDLNPEATLIEPRGNAFAYRGLWLEDLYIARLSDPIAGDPQSDTWQRFAHEKKIFKARDFGVFTLLEFGFPSPNVSGRPRFLAGVWYPNQPLGDVADVNVFFSPNTGAPYPADAYPFSKAYPYQLSPKAGRAGPNYTIADLDALYVGLAHNYVCTGYKIVYQMLAAGKNSIIVMPIQPASQWGPLQTRACLWRLVVEAVRFGEAQRLIARRGKVGQLALTRENAGVDADSAGIAGAAFDHSQIRLTTSAFSAGLGAMLGLINTANQDEKRYPNSHFAAPDAECQSAWKAIWDVDGAFNQLGGWEACVRQLVGWRKGGRTLRMYHSEDTINSNAQVSTLIPGIDIKRKTGKTGFMDQGYTSDRSVLWTLFSNPSLRTASPADVAANVWPVLGSQDAHHMVPTVVFGHAWHVA